jgi:hypothetical protein
MSLIKGLRDKPSRLTVAPEAPASGRGSRPRVLDGHYRGRPGALVQELLICQLALLTKQQNDVLRSSGLSNRKRFRCRPRQVRPHHNQSSSTADLRLR